MEHFPYIGLGLVIGIVIGWLFAVWRKGPAPADDALTGELRRQLEQRESELSQVRSESSQAAAALAAADADRTGAVMALAEQRQLQEQAAAAAAQTTAKLETDIAALRDKCAGLGGELARVAAQLAAERNALAEARTAHERTGANLAQFQEQLLATKTRNGELEARVKFLDERLATERQQIETIQEKFRKDFEAVSNKLLVDSSSRFNQQSSESLGKLLAPLKESLGEFKSGLDATRKETAAHSALLKDQISRIGAEAANLSKALKGDIKALGNWGENMLDQILEKSGLQLDVHYHRQRGAKDAEGDQRFLDVIIELPEKRSLVIDSKVSLRSYEEAVNCPDEPARLAHLDRHVDAIRAHFRELGAKRYQDSHAINAPDFVLMYVPIEAAFFAAVARTPALFAEALDRNVVLITNSTLLATLRTVAHVWGLADQQKHALKIAERGARLYDKFVGFVEDLNDVGKGLKAAQTAWDDASNKLHTGKGNLIGQAEELKTLGVKAAKALPPSLVEKAAELQAPPSALPPA